MHIRKYRSTFMCTYMFYSFQYSQQDNSFTNNICKFDDLIIIIISSDLYPNTVSRSKVQETK